MSMRLLCDVKLTMFQLSKIYNKSQHDNNDGFGLDQYAQLNYGPKLKNYAYRYQY